MTKKAKIILIVSIVFAVLAATVTVVCYSTGVFDKNDPETWYEPAKDGGIDDALAEQIKIGMTFDEIVDVIGKPQRDIGSGVLQLEWEMKSGKVLVVCFNSKTSNNYGENPISEPIEHNWVSYHIDIRTK